MKITNVHILLLSSPVPKENQWRSAYGTLVKIDNILVIVETDEGIEGLGATHGNPGAVKAIVDDVFGPFIVGEDAADIEGLREKMLQAIGIRPERSGWSTTTQGRSNEALCAISAIDIALWDIRGKAMGLPIYKVLGAKRSRVQAYASSGSASTDTLSRYAARGFDAVKIYAGTGADSSFARVVKRISDARQVLGPDVELMVDGHGAFDIVTACRLAKELEDYNVAWFEEPVPHGDHHGLAKVRASTKLPIATGEKEQSRSGFLSLMVKEAVDIVQPDIGIVGGFTEVRLIGALASAFGVKVSPHAWASGVLFAASLHMAMSAPTCHIFGVSQNPFPLVYELFQESIKVEGGQVFAPQGPGLGFTLRDDVEERFPYTHGSMFAN